jgi:predicted enzyme involved in methoxymalonyl-ACP biosynthesis
VLVASYKDKYGQLGKIAVLGARVDGRALLVDAWVLSCRAFSRRIEHQCLRQLFHRFGVDEVVFEFQPTPRNSPLQEFFTELSGSKPAGRVALQYADFEKQCPQLFHTVKEGNHERRGREIDQLFPSSFSQKRH